MVKYKCTYTSNKGVGCPVMGRYNKPDPAYCFAYDTEIWDYNPKMTCRYCVPLSEGENPEKKIWCDQNGVWCDQMPFCDTYNEGGSKECEGCPAGWVVFDPGKELFRDKQECLVKWVCPRGDGFCTEGCHLCLEVSTLNGDDIYICIAAAHEVVPIEIDLTPGVGQ